MTTCTLCDHEMKIAPSCSVDTLHRAGTAVAVLPYGQDPGWKRAGPRCPDCGVERGGLHHLGCDIQACPLCRRQLISCDCGWDEPGGAEEDADDDDGDQGDDRDGDGDEDEAIVLPIARTPAGPVRPRTFPPVAEVTGPLRARHHDQLRRLAAWALAEGRSTDLGIAAICLEELDAHRTEHGAYVLDRPTVNQVMWADVHNAVTCLGARLPERWEVELWTVLSWLHADGQLDAMCDPIDVLREPLRCYALLGVDGHPMPEGVDVEFACQCYVPFDPTLPPGIALHVVGHDPETHDQHLARARLRPRSTPATTVDYGPLCAMARRLRRERSWLRVHVDEFSFAGVVVPEGKTPELWLYHHDPTRRRGFEALVVDAEGHPWIPRPDGRRRRGFRWTRGNDMVAIFRSGAGRDEREDDSYDSWVGAEGLEPPTPSL